MTSASRQNELKIFFQSYLQGLPTFQVAVSGATGGVTSGFLDRYFAGQSTAGDVLRDAVIGGAVGLATGGLAALPTKLLTQ